MLSLIKMAFQCENIGHQDKLPKDIMSATTLSKKTSATHFSLILSHVLLFLKITIKFVESIYDTHMNLQIE